LILKKDILKQFDFALLALILLSICIFPLIKVKSNLYLGLEEFLLPLILMRLYKKNISYLKLFIITSTLLCLYILLTIIINGRIACYRDYFEIYKIFRFAIVLAFAAEVLKNNFLRFDTLVKICFLILVILNLMHYFNLFDFNTYIQPYYSLTEVQLKYFGVDTLGNKAVRRMLGTMDNPNMNAILFMMFFSYFLSKESYKSFNFNRIYIYITFFCLILTQSRTGFISMVLVYILWLFLTKQRLKMVLKDVGIFISLMLLALLIDNYALMYFSNTVTPLTDEDIAFLHSQKSLMGRLEIWTHLWGMIQEKPLCGYGPNKEYFYNNNIYPESAYVLYLWRYGFFGLIILLTWLFTPLYKKFEYVYKEPFFFLFLISILLNGITNSPLTDQKIFILLAIVAAYHYAVVHNENIKDEIHK